jgi:D-beta-D-heptose 7-phosphate kinase/D-beta-D-heptose 1-phosphate adenosyltransferase
MSKVLVLGDIIIDKYVYGTSSRISPEAPVPVITYSEEKETLGGAGLVYENLKSLGVDVSLFEHNQPCSIKTRIICDGHYITRIDKDKNAKSNVVLDEVLCSDFSEYDYVILSDYDKGVLDNAKQIIAHINSQGPKVIVDPKRYAHDYEDAWLIKPNNSEYTKFEFDEWQGNIITTDAGHSVFATIDNKEYKVSVETVEVSDVTGAGDCFMAAFVYGLTKGYPYKKCLEVAVKGSTESVKHAGTYILKETDLQKRIIFTNGCFDILHKGHLTLLKKARNLGDKLIVGLNTDNSVKKLKGPSRPVNNQQTRLEQLEILDWVDEVILFDEDTPYNLIKKINPDLIVKGGDYKVDEIVGHDLAPVHIIPTVQGYSTTNIIENTNENINYRL